jgi:hypothetical protein
MTIFTSSIPLWVSILFMCIFPFYIFLISNAVKTSGIKLEFGERKTKKISNRILIFGFAYLVIIALVSFTEFFKVNSLPPRILITSTLPLLLFYLLVLSRTAAYKTIIKTISLQSLVRLHIFRLIGVFFLITYYYGALPKYFAIAGGIGDMFAAITAIFVAYALDKKKPYAIKLTWLWNIIGLLDILNVAISAVVATRLSLTTNAQSVLEIANFPFVWIPAFAPATIIFIHVSIFKKLSMQKLN